jgi:protein SCO1/2
VNNATQLSHKKLIVIILTLAAIVATLVVSFGVIRHQQRIYDVKSIKIDGFFLPTPKDLHNFQLTTNDGKPFTKDSLKGHMTLMFFGFTNCRYVCPTTLATLNKVYQILQKELPENKLPQIVMVSVDPERDTVVKMNTYINSFNSHFIGVRGDMVQTHALAKQLNIVAIKVQEGKGKNDYYMDHSAEILVFNPDGQLQAYLSYPHKTKQLVEEYKSMLSAIGS